MPLVEGVDLRVLRDSIARLQADIQHRSDEAWTGLALCEMSHTHRLDYECFLCKLL